MAMRTTLRSVIAASLVVLAITASGVANAGSENGNFMVRALVSGVIPDEKVDVTTGGTTIRNGADITDAWIASTTLTYFFTPNISAELFCCVTQHNAKGKGAAAAFGEVGDMWLFPPTVTLQYHVTGMGVLKPYLGVGVTYINFFDEKAGGALTGTRLEVDSAWGVALQAGLDVSLGSGWYANADVKKIFLETDATWTTTAGATAATAKIDLDPWIFSFGVGYRFNIEDIFSRRTTAASLK
jgi:outer membrane protein